MSTIRPGDDFAAHGTATFGPLWNAPRRSISRILKSLLVWQERSRQRRHLMQLDDGMLKDIGLSRADA